MMLSRMTFAWETEQPVFSPQYWVGWRGWGKSIEIMINWGSIFRKHGKFVLLRLLPTHCFLHA